MFERFNDRARQVMVLAQEEARLLNHSYIGTEHILLALIREGDGVAAQVLKSLNISFQAVPQRLKEIIGRAQGAPTDHPPFTPHARKALEAASRQAEEIVGGGEAPPTSFIPFTPRAKKVLELSLREALQLGHNYIGTEHLLLGLIREGDGIAAQVLQKQGADGNRVRQTVIQLLSGDRPGMSFETARQEVPTAVNPPSLLDDREKIVLSLLLEGQTTSGIADVLGVSEERVREITQSVIQTLKDL